MRSRSPTSPRYARRLFLRGLGLSPALLPMLSAERARAGCLDQGPKRLVILNWPNGVTAWPAAASSAPDIQLPPFMVALEPFKAECLFVKGLRFRAVQESPNPRVPPDGHQSHAGVLTGKRAFRLVDKYSVADGPSIDQHVAAALGKKGFAGLPSLNLGVIKTYASTSWKGSQQPVEPDNDPYHVFDRLFGGAPGAAPNPELERLRQARKSILDVVGRDLERFARRVGGDDQVKVRAHLEAIRDIEKQLAPLARPSSCAPPALGPGTRLDIKAPANFPALWKLQMDIAVAALAADLTRVVVIQVGNDSNHHVPATWLGFSDSHHDIAHNGPTARKATLDRWYHDQYAYLLGKLKAEKEGARTMLDASACVAVHNMEHGLHAINRVPWIIGGGCHGAFRPGRSLQRGLVPRRRRCGTPRSTGRRREAAPAKPPQAEK
jgi:hypothetical protein